MHRQHSLSGDFLAGTLVAILLTVGPVNWEFHGFLVLVGLAIISHLCWRLGSHVVVRLLCALIFCCVFVSITSGPIWADFHKEHPKIAARALLQSAVKKASEIVDFVNIPAVRWPLVAIAVLLLIWGSRPVWRLRRGLFSRLKSLLGEKVWLDRETAITLLKDSTWARLAKMKAAEPREAINYLAVFTGQQTRPSKPNPEREKIEFDAFIELALDNFERDNPDYVKTDEEGKKQYLEDRLNAFIRKAMAAEVSEKYGAIPSGKV